MSKQSCVICLECGTILVSLSGHDYRSCGCPNQTMIDGGASYQRCGGISLHKVKSGVWDTERNKFIANKYEEFKSELDGSRSKTDKSRFTY